LLLSCLRIGFPESIPTELPLSLTLRFNSGKHQRSSCTGLDFRIRIFQEAHQHRNNFFTHHAFSLWMSTVQKRWLSCLLELHLLSLQLPTASRHAWTPAALRRLLTTVLTQPPLSSLWTHGVLTVSQVAGTTIQPQRKERACLLVPGVY